MMTRELRVITKFHSLFINVSKCILILIRAVHVSLCIVLSAPIRTVEHTHLNGMMNNI